MITQLICTIWTSLSAFPKKAVKFNQSLTPTGLCSPTLPGPSSTLVSVPLLCLAHFSHWSLFPYPAWLIFHTDLCSPTLPGPSSTLVSVPLPCLAHLPHWSLFPYPAGPIFHTDLCSPTLPGPSSTLISVPLPCLAHLSHWSLFPYPAWPIFHTDLCSPTLPGSSFTVISVPLPCRAHLSHWSLFPYLAWPHLPHCVIVFTYPAWLIFHNDLSLFPYFITNCGQHQRVIPSPLSIALKALLEENTTRKWLSLSLLVLQNFAFHVAFLIFFSIAIFSLTFFLLVCHCSLWLYFSQGISF